MQRHTGDIRSEVVTKLCHSEKYVQNGKILILIQYVQNDNTDKWQAT